MESVDFNENGEQAPAGRVQREPGRIVLPGEMVADRPTDMEGCFVAAGRTYVGVISLLREGKVIPLKGHYLPTPGDYVVGIVTEERFSGYNIDLHSAYEGTFSTRDVREEFKVGEVISAKILDVNEVNEATLGEPRKFSGGQLLEVDFVKVPRIIGRGGSMLEMIRSYTGTDLFIGKNGRIYMRGGNTALATLAILKIDREAHVQGLTDRLKEFLEVESKRA
ncbi:hypothetical protein HY995_04155 [Candidatus Micrarchaeota archaeon]|nr:hypothetical protein [Candidatus Micrarchaeota archaeon]MBI5177251.1 hypothetical protein [Candidatus Micrarchaeota archaeon]